MIYVIVVVFFYFVVSLIMIAANYSKTQIQIYKAISAVRLGLLGGGECYSVGDCISVYRKKSCVFYRHRFCCRRLILGSKDSEKCIRTEKEVFYICWTPLMNKV